MALGACCGSPRAACALRCTRADPNTCLYTIEGTPEYDFQWRWTQQADMLARTPKFEYLLTAEDKQFCESYNTNLISQYKQFFEDGDKLEIPDKVTFPQ